MCLCGDSQCPSCGFLQGTLEPKPRKRRKYFVGLDGMDGARVIFNRIDNQTPMRKDYPEYNAVIGPFRTKRGAKFMLKFGQGNPHCRNVSDAEKLGKKYAKDL